MPGPAEIGIAISIMAFGSAVQAAFGLGMALLVVPLLALLDAQFIPGPMLFAGIALAAGTAYRDRAELDRIDLGVSLVGLAVGTAIGAVALKLVNPVYLSKLFGALILLAVLISLTAQNVSLNRKSLLAGSTVSGIMGTMVGVHGPAISLVLQNARPPQVRALLGAYFAIGYTVAVAALAIVGVFGRHGLMLGLILLPGAILGYLIAPAISRFVNKDVLRIVILVMSSASAVALVLR